MPRRAPSTTSSAARPPRDPQTLATAQAQPVPAWAIDYQTLGKALGTWAKDIGPGLIEHARQMAAEAPEATGRSLRRTHTADS